MTKNDLTTNQRMVLEAAANRDDHVAWPVPKLLGLSKGSATLVIRSLMKKGLVAERPAVSNNAVWRENEGQPLTVVITEDALEALGLLPNEDADAGANVQEGDKGPADSAAQQDEAPAGASPDAANEGATNHDTAVTAADTDQPRQPRPGTKLAALVALLSRPEGATIEEMVIATGWQAHSVRGVMSGALAKRFGLTIVSEKVERRGRVYRVNMTGEGCSAG